MCHPFSCQKMYFVSHSLLSKNVISKAPELENNEAEEFFNSKMSKYENKKKMFAVI